MKTTARSIPFAPFAVAAALLTAFLVLFAPLPASAHDALVSSSPAADGTVDTLPGEITLTFSEKLITGEGATEVVVTDASGASVTNGPAAMNGAVVTQPLVTQAEAGAYHVIWKVVSSDGHPTSGEYTFTVTNSTVPAPVESSAPTTEPSHIPGSATPTAVAPTPADPAENSVGLWLLGIIGALVIAAIVIVVLSRRGNRSSTGSSTPSAR